MLIELHQEWAVLKAKAKEGKRNESKQNFEEKIAMPFDISKNNYEAIMSRSGILDWKEDVAYLASQLTREQPSHLGSLDVRQLKCDMRREERRVSELAALDCDKNLENAVEKKARAPRRSRLDLLCEAEPPGTSRREERRVSELAALEKENEEEAERQSSAFDINNADADDDQLLDVNENEDSYEPNMRLVKNKRKIDVMGPISQAADARNISLGDRAVMVAATLKAVGVDIDTTNCNKTSAWRKGRSARVKRAREIKEGFSCPSKVVIHWDGKTLKLRGKITSNRVCVYLSGLGNQSEIRKLLGIPGAETGTGADEFKIVQKSLDDWNVGDEVTGMVFDTTATNTGKEKGCCR